jgi:hypothetical protein
MKKTKNLNYEHKQTIDIYSSYNKAFEEYESDGGWVRHCQIRAAIILSYYNFDSNKQREYVFDEYVASLYDYADELWYSSDKTKPTIDKFVAESKKNYKRRK